MGDQTAAGISLRTSTDHFWPQAISVQCHPGEHEVECLLARLERGSSLDE